MVNCKTNNQKFSIITAIIMILLCINLMVQESAFTLNLQGRWIYIVDSLLFLVILVELYSKRKIKLLQIKDGLRILIPFVIITLYSLILNCLNYELPFTEIVIAGLYWIIPVIISIVIYLNFNSSFIYVLYYSILANYSAVIFKCFMIEGVSYFFKLSTYTDNFGSVLEVHTIGLSLPLFLIYFLYDHYQNNSKLGLSFWIGLIYTFMGGKRIALLGLAVVTVLYYIIKNYNIKVTKLKIILYALALFIISFLYLFFVKLDGFALLLEFLEVNGNSRIETWLELSGMYDISPFYLGKGIGFSMYYLKNLEGVYINGYLNRVGDVHNDILKSYIDLGFFMFAYLIWFLFVKNTIFFIKKQCRATANLYGLMMLYTMLLMFVDNILRYDLYIISLFSISFLNMKEEIFNNNIKK